jgi:hypothetical protein
MAVAHNFLLPASFPCQMQAPEQQLNRPPEKQSFGKAKRVSVTFLVACIGGVLYHSGSLLLTVMKLFGALLAERKYGQEWHDVNIAVHFHLVRTLFTLTTDCLVICVAIGDVFSWLLVPSELWSGLVPVWARTSRTAPLIGGSTPVRPVP